MKLISEDLITAVLRYLAQRPYQEVAQAIQALSQLQDAPSADNVELADRRFREEKK